MIQILINILGLSYGRRLITYVHNLPYEFQFIRKRFEWEEVFILSNRKPVYCHTNGVEFRCSLKLAGGKSLANVGKDLQKYKCEKMVGDLDYSKIRTPFTNLSPEELLYCENDIRVLLCYIQEKIEQDGDITRIPLTNTGYVRNYCRKQCFKRWKRYHNMISELTIDADEYSQLKRAFQGGFTHANAGYVDKILTDIGSHDLTSSYPAVLVLEKFPMSKGELIAGEITIEDFINYIKHYACLFELELFNVSPRLYHEHPLSKSKCYVCEGAIVDNGRIAEAEHICTTCTEQDFWTYNAFYNWERFNIKNLRVYTKAYLPHNLVKAILSLYEKKTKLKGVKNEEINYMIQKNMINACFGMMVTDPVRQEIKYEEDEFVPQEKDIESTLEKYNSNVKRFIFYPWGVWTTAYARANLFSSIMEFGVDYVYSDTDSIKSRNTGKHREYFERYNANIEEKIKKSADFHHFPESWYRPETKDGIPKPIGVWDDEGVYSHFKTLGAKRYLTQKRERQKPFEEDGLEISLEVPKTRITLAGANKDKTSDYLVKSKNAFNVFSNNLTIPPEYSGRLLLTYIDYETEGIVFDYLGVGYHYHELSSVHMEPSEYNLSRAQEFIDYLLGLEDFSE